MSIITSTATRWVSTLRPLAASLATASSKQMSGAAASAGGKKVATVSSGSDNGANNCLAERLKAARHGDTKTAIANLTSKLAAGITGFNRFGALDTDLFSAGKGQPYIAGHGDDGFLTTGAGQDDQQTFDNTVGTWNEDNWGPHFDNLKPKNYVMFTILSCYTGAGEDGAELLFNIAKRTNHAVRARTGLTSCGSGGITFQEGSTWQVATPEKKPTPIPRPASLRFFSTKDITLKGDGDTVTINRDDVSRIEISKKASYTSAKTQETLDNADMLNGVLDTIDFANPFGIGTGPETALLGMITAKLSIQFRSRDGVRDFVVYNNSILQDVEHPDTYYWVSPGFKSLLDKML